MKKIYSLILTLLIGFAVTSCSDEFVDGLTFTNDPHYLSVDKSSLSFGSGADTQSFAVTSIGTSWTVSNNASWISLSTNAGTSSAEVPVAVSENTEYSDKNRAAVLDISGSNGVKSRTVTVNQEAPDLHLSVSTNSVSFEAQGGLNLNIAVNCNNEWSISVADNTWLEVTKNASSITLKTKTDNTTGAERSTTVSVQSGSKIETIRVTQKVGTITISPSTLTFDYSGGTKAIQLTSDVAWTGTKNDDWVKTISPESGNAGTTPKTVYITVDKNTNKTNRTAYVKFLDKILTVNQDAFQSQLTVSPTTVTLSSSGDSRNITITSNEEWDYTCADSWLQIKRISSGLNISANENTATESRTIYINVTAGTESKTITVVQLPAGTSVLPDSLNFDFSRSSQSLSYTSDASWQAKSSNPSWLGVSPTSGSAGTTKLTVEVSENASRYPREGSITIDNKTIKVIQGAVELSVLPSSLSFSADGETRQLTISSNTSWKINDNNTKSWLTFSKTEDSGNQSINVTATKNTGAVKEDVVSIETTNGVTTELRLSQSAAEIQVINDLAEFPAVGGSTVFTPKEAISWTASVESGTDWIHISSSSGSSDKEFTITVDKNTSDSDRSSYVDVKYDDNSTIIYRLVIRQFGLDISTSVSSYNFLAKGGTSDAIAINTDGDVNVRTSATWLNARLNGNLLTITADENLSGSQRTGIVTLTLVGTSKSITINVTQNLQHGDINIDDYGEWDSVIIHESVDLGLSVKWATMNVGATSPEDYGDYFAWGETDSKSLYDWSTYKWCKGSFTSMTKYCASSYWGTVDNITTLESYDDAATVNWGETWRMPTESELIELCSNCKCMWTTQNGVNGYKMTGTNGNSIFLPAAGYYGDSSIKNSSLVGCYGLNSINSPYSYCASISELNSNGVYRTKINRCCGISVRPVCQ